MTTTTNDRIDHFAPVHARRVNNIMPVSYMIHTWNASILCIEFTCSMHRMHQCNARNVHVPVLSHEICMIHAHCSQQDLATCMHEKARNLVY